jgi:hypothetical protein
MYSGVKPADAQSGPLPSWNDGARKQPIVEFVTRATKVNGVDFVEYPSALPHPNTSRRDRTRRHMKFPLGAFAKNSTADDAISTVRKGGLNRRALLSGAAVLPVLPSFLLGNTQSAAAQQAGFGLSFAVYGDSRPVMYLPSKDGRPDLIKLFVEMFGLVMPGKVAEEVVKRDVKMIFDPATNELIRVVMPFMSRTEVMTLTVDQGWVTRATVEDVKLLPGVHRDMFELAGGEWVAREIVQQVRTGRGPNL